MYLMYGIGCDRGGMKVLVEWEGDSFYFDILK